MWDVLAPVRNCWTEDFRAGEGSGQEEGPCLQGGRRDLRVLRWAHAWGPHPGLLSAGALTGRSGDHFFLRQELQAGRWSSVGAQVSWDYGLLPWSV